MRIFLAVFILTIVLTKAIQGLFIRLKLTKQNYKGINVPFSGGTTLFLGIVGGFLILRIYGNISSFKMLFFTLIIFVVYAIGLVDDIIGDRSIKGIGGNIKSIFNKRMSTGILKAGGILIISCYLYYFFNEEFWILKGFLTAIITNMFNLFDLRPGRCSKIYFLLFSIIALSSLRWTREVYSISLMVLISYYFFDAYGYSMLGDSGSNLLGFIYGLVLSETIGTNFLYLAAIFIVIIIIQLTLDRYSLTRIISKVPFLDYVDRLITERQDEENAKA